MGEGARQPAGALAQQLGDSGTERCHVLLRCAQGSDLHLEPGNARDLCAQPLEFLALRNDRRLLRRDGALLLVQLVSSIGVRNWYITVSTRPSAERATSSGRTSATSSAISPYWSAGPPGLGSSL